MSELRDERQVLQAQHFSTKYIDRVRGRLIRVFGNQSAGLVDFFVRDHIAPILQEMILEAMERQRLISQEQLDLIEKAYKQQVECPAPPTLPGGALTPPVAPDDPRTASERQGITLHGGTKREKGERIRAVFTECKNVSVSRHESGNTYKGFMPDGAPFNSVSLARWSHVSPNMTCRFLSNHFANLRSVESGT